MTSTASVRRNEAMQAHEIAVTPPTVRTDDPITKAVQVVVVVNRLPGPIVDDADRRETSSDDLAGQAAAERSKAQPRPTATRLRRHRARNDRLGKASRTSELHMETRSADKLPRLSRPARVLLIVAVGFIALLLVGPRLVGAYVDWLWFGEVGFRSVWVTVLLTRVAIFVAVALVVGGTVFLALMLAYRSRPVFLPAARTNDPIAPYRTQVMRRSRLIGWGVAVAVGVLCGLIAQSNWVTVQLFLHGGSLGVVDPEFGHDIGFFVFDLPFYRSVLNWLFVAVFLALLASLATHYLFGGLRLTTGKDMLTGPPAFSSRCSPAHSSC